MFVVQGVLSDKTLTDKQKNIINALDAKIYDIKFTKKGGTRRRKKAAGLYTKLLLDFGIEKNLVKANAEIWSVLEVIEDSDYNVNNAYDVVAIEKDLIQPLINTLDKHDHVGLGIDTFLKSAYLYNDNSTTNMRTKYVETLSHKMQTKYFHALSNVANIAHSLAANTEVDQTFVDRCNAEWPASLIKK